MKYVSGQIIKCVIKFGNLFLKAPGNSPITMYGTEYLTKLEGKCLILLGFKIVENVNKNIKKGMN